MWPRTELTDLLGIDHPIIQAPMSGSDGPALAAAVSNAGAVGSLGCGEMSVEKLRKEFDETRSSTTQPFIINFFAHDTPAYPSDDAATMCKQLATYYEELGLGQTLTLSASPMRPFDTAILEEILELQPDIVSFHFGLPTEEVLDALKSAGSIILCSATTVAEAKQLEAGGVHAIIAQGYDAGGHRGTFSEPLEAGNVGTFSLVPQVVDAVSVPVIAAGGIADGRGIAAAFALGASGVQMGTAFLLCPESASSPIHREVLQRARDNGTIVTRAFTGRPARAVIIRFVEEMDSQDREVAAFPLQDSLTLPLHMKSVEQGSMDFAALFSGQASSLSRSLPAGMLVDALVDEAQEIFGK